MKYLVFIVSLVVVSASFAQENIPGTGVANGGGRNTNTSGWTPLFPFGSMKGELVRDYDRFLEKHPLALNFCKDYPEILFPPMPESMKGRFQFADFRGRDLSLKEICTTKRWVKLYASWMFSMYGVMDSPRFMGLMNLLAKVDPQPVRVELHRDRRTVYARGGEEEEFTWFDQEKGAIGWSTRKSPNDFFSEILGRCESAYLMHELAHVLSYRILGGYKRVPYWHDNRKEKEIYEKENGISVRVKSNFYDFETGEYQALIEGLSNLAEVGYSLEHPMIDDVNGIQRFYRDINGGNVYWTFGGGRFAKTREQLLKNEAFVSSILSYLVTELRLDEERSGTIHDHSDQKIVQIFQAFAKSKSVNLIDLLKTYDEVAQTDHGWRLSNEFLLYDYRTGQDLSHTMDTRFTADTWSLGGVVFDGRVELRTNEVFRAENLLSPMIEANRR